MVTLKGYTANMLGLSTDQKPTDAEVNTIIRELDTNKYYYFDGTDWNEIPNTGGGGGGGFTPTQTQLDAMNSGITSGGVEQIGTNTNNISSLQDSVNGREFTFTSGGNIATNVDVGETVEITPNPVGSWSYTISPCNAGEVITINGQGGSTPRLWAFTDKDYKLISKSADGAGMTGGTVTAPTNAAYCIINSTTATLGFCGIYGVKDDISSIQQTIGDINTVLEGVL